MAVSKDTIKLALDYVSVTSQALKVAAELQESQARKQQAIEKKADSVRKQLLDGRFIDEHEEKMAAVVLGSHEGALDTLAGLLNSRLTPGVKAASLGVGVNSENEAGAEKPAAATNVVHLGQRLPIGQRQSDLVYRQQMLH